MVVVTSGDAHGCRGKRKSACWRGDGSSPGGRIHKQGQVPPAEHRAPHHGIPSWEMFWGQLWLLQPASPARAWGSGMLLGWAGLLGTHRGGGDWCNQGAGSPSECWDEEQPHQVEMRSQQGFPTPWHPSLQCSRLPLASRVQLCLGQATSLCGPLFSHLYNGLCGL